MLFKRNYLVIYDVCKDKVRRKVVKELEKYGIRVQFSAFECMLNMKTKKLLINEIESLLGTNDSVRIYKLPSSVYVVGKGEDVYNDEGEILVI